MVKTEMKRCASLLVLMFAFVSLGVGVGLSDCPGYPENQLQERISEIREKRLNRIMERRRQAKEGSLGNYTINSISKMDFENFEKSIWEDKSLSNTLVRARLDYQYYSTFTEALQRVNEGGQYRIFHVTFSGPDLDRHGRKKVPSYDERSHPKQELTETITVWEFVGDDSRTRVLRNGRLSSREQMVKLADQGLWHFVDLKQKVHWFYSSARKARMSRIVMPGPDTDEIYYPCVAEWGAFNASYLRSLDFVFRSNGLGYDVTFYTENGEKIYMGRLSLCGGVNVGGLKKRVYLWMKQVGRVPQKMYGKRLSKPVARYGSGKVIKKCIDGVWEVPSEKALGKTTRYTGTRWVGGGRSVGADGTTTTIDVYQPYSYTRTKRYSNYYGGYTYEQLRDLADEYEKQKELNARLNTKPAGADIRLEILGAKIECVLSTKSTRK